MDKMSRLFIFHLLLMLGSYGAFADQSPITLYRISLLPHQAWICDVIFSGTVLSTNFTAQSPRQHEYPAAEFAVDDVLWGTLTSSNIVVGSVYPSEVDNFMPGERYLVCAFTNNWWANMSRGDTDFERLSNYLSVTGAPREMLFWMDTAQFIHITRLSPLTESIITEQTIGRLRAHL